MEYSYVKVLGVYRRTNFIQLYLDRPLGYPIVPVSLYDIHHNNNSIIAPISNGNNIKCLRFIIPKNKNTYWINKLTERDLVKVSKAPVISNTFTPKTNDILLAFGNGIANFTSYFTNDNECILPSMLYYENKCINDMFELPLINTVMNNKFKLFITGKVSNDQMSVVKNNDNLNKILKFNSSINYLTVPPDSKLYVSGATKHTLNVLTKKNIPYTILPVNA